MNLLELNRRALAFAAARKRQLETREALTNYRQEHGSCAVGHEWDGTDGYVSECFRAKALPREEWCEACAESQPLWEARRQAATEAGVAMHRLLSLCERELREMA